MKKIMFNDKYGLTAAVLAGTKTQTRRIIPQSIVDELYYAGFYGDFTDNLKQIIIKNKSRYKVGEVVAVAQSYRDIDGKSDKYLNEWCGIVACDGMNGAGYNNKMFIKAELMPHKIEITGIRVERLQDISEVDCIREGVFDLEPYGIRPKFTVDNLGKVFLTEKEAYAALIDKISGKDTWKSNPWTFVYDFSLVK